MINWELLYNKLIVERKFDKSIKGEKHHIIPHHDNGNNDKDNYVKLNHKNHILAHYIRWRWLKQLGDKIAYLMMLSQIDNPMHDPDMLKKTQRNYEFRNYKIKIK